MGGFGPQNIVSTDQPAPPNPLQTITGIGSLATGLIGGLGNLLGTG